ncbi:MAG TPA: cytochrome C [Gammaproteobacteria bacterium]|nr:cytochrome C [Gammaproteobacteria bacterium]
MNKTELHYLLTSTTVLALSLSFNGAANAGTIVGTAHDLSANGYSGGEICVVCHTPHNSDTSVNEAPLWNHAVTSQTFTMYSTGTLDAAQDGQPSGTSKLCLSCHDGVTAIDSFGGNSGNIVMNDLSKAVGASGDLSNDHPISITYDTTLSQTDPGLHDPATQTVTIGAGGDKIRTGTVASLMLSGGKVQCSSCHDVHNNFVGPGTNDQPFLKVSKSGSLICLTCHNK